MGWAIEPQPSECVAQMNACGDERDGESMGECPLLQDDRHSH
jgi:hypothetical protein